MSQPYLFDEFFASGREESISPFLTEKARRWSRNLSLKSALLAAFFLLLTFILSFTNEYASNISLSAVYFLVGTPALINALEDLRGLKINIDVLMTLAALLSVIIGSGLEGGLLLVLFEFSGALESMVTQKTKGALYNLQGLSPKTAQVLQEDGTLLEQSVHDIPVGTKVLVKAGEVVPLDGTVVVGSSFVELTHLTGESTPRPMHVEDTVPAGAQNLDGSLTVEVTKTSRESTLSNIIELVKQAQASKPKVERLFDRFGKNYSIAIILLSTIFAIILPLALSIPFLGPEGSIYRALAFLIAASPCALIIATPTAYLSALSACARRGIVLKGGSTLDALASCAIAAFDKTGTLTTGKLKCTNVTSLRGSEPIDRAIAIAAGLEKHAVHPMGEAILVLASERGITPADIDTFNSVPGYGLEGTVDTTAIKIGHPNFVAHSPPPGGDEELSTYLQVGDALFVFTFEDEIREEARQSIPALHKEGLSLALLTGDHSQNASNVGKALAIEQVFSDMRPEDKLRKVSELNERGGLIMVGDGVNDAPALTRATVGISMGKIGSATAINASDVVFLHDDLSSLNWLLAKAKKTLNLVRQNIFLALGVIVLATTPALLGFIPLWLAVILHEGGTVIVGLNSLRLLK